MLALLVVDDLLVVPHKLAVVVVVELQVEYCWHMGMELLVVNADTHQVVRL